MQVPDWIGYLIYAVNLVITIGLSIHILLRKRPTGVTIAWLLIILLAPFISALLYLFLGENRLDEKRLTRARHIHELHEHKLAQLALKCGAKPDIPPALTSIRDLAQSVIGFPVQSGNDLRLLQSYPEIFEAMIRDIDRANIYCHLEFYIWHHGGYADQVADALKRATQRGVTCRVLLDAVGSKKFLRGKVVRKMRNAGLEVQGTLKVSAYRVLFRRADLRNHRKIVVIDNQIAYTGSQNLVDPRHFKQEQGVGEWIDVMVRVEGPSSEALDDIFIEDWQLETGLGMELLENRPPNLGLTNSQTPVQIIPSGPVFRFMALHQLLTTIIYSAKRELIITTPYFVPDEALYMALLAAAHRGVQITLIVPEEVDSLMVRYASRSMFDGLLDAGVRIAEYRGGLLHTKSITVDEHFTLIGSVSMDMRSLWLNFEISLFVYDSAFTQQIRKLLREYLQNCIPIDPQEWKNRPGYRQFMESVFRHVSPLLQYLQIISPGGLCCRVV